MYHIHKITENKFVYEIRHNILFFSLFQRQDTDERLRRLQTDKESLALQVQVLSEQVSAQHERINELENKLTEKTQLMNNVEDLLHRVSSFATTVSGEIEKQKVSVINYYFFLVLLF